MKNKPFYILVAEPSFFKKGDVIETKAYKFLVLKYCKNIWWRRWLQKLGIETHIGLTKVIQINEVN